MPMGSRKPLRLVLVAGVLAAGAGVAFWLWRPTADRAAIRSPEVAAREADARAQLAVREEQRSAAADADRRNRQELAAFEAELAQARVAKDAGKLFELAQRLESGTGVERDLAKAQALFEEAARGGNAKAMLRAGDFAAKALASGEPRAEDALSWYEKAAEAGEADGLARIARMYLEGTAVAVDLATAQQYIERGVEAGSVDALFLKGVTLFGTKETTDEALRCLADAAAKGSTDAQALLARLYAEGKALPRDIGEAMAWARMAAANGSTTAAVDLAKLLLANGGNLGDAAATAEAADLLLKADDQRSARAAWELAALQIGERNRGGGGSEALRRNFQQAYDQGSTAAAFGMAMTYRGQDTGSVVAWLDKGVERNDWRSSYARTLYGKGMELGAALDTAAKATMEQYLAYKVKADNQDARIVMPVPLQTPRPELPTELSVLSFKGSAMAEFVVGEDGTPQAINVVGATHPQLEAAVREAVAKWKFKPGTRNGAYYPQPMRVPFRFQSGK